MNPILAVSEYHKITYYDGSKTTACFMTVDTFWPAAFFLMTISVFFILPFAVLIVLYSVIARHLMAAPGITVSSASAPTVLARCAQQSRQTRIIRADCNSMGCSTGGAQVPALPRIREGSVRVPLSRGTTTTASATSSASSSANYRHRRQVVVMLGTVVVSFFVCLTPFRILTIMVIAGEAGALGALGADAYYGILFASRLLIYLHSALNPCLYNLMSSKFRRGFGRLFCCECCREKRRGRRHKRRGRQSGSGGDWWRRRGREGGGNSSFTSQGADDGDARPSDYATYSSGSFSSTWAFGRRSGMPSSSASSSSSGRRRRHRSSTTSSSLGSFTNGHHRRTESLVALGARRSPEVGAAAEGGGTKGSPIVQGSERACSVSRTSSIANGRGNCREGSRRPALRREESYV